MWKPRARGRERLRGQLREARRRKERCSLARGGRLEEAATAVKQFVVAKASELVVAGDGSKAQLTTIAA